MPPAPLKSFRDEYQARVASGTIEPDPAQAQAVEAIAALDAALSTYKPPRKQGFFARLFGDKDARPPRGLYVFGEVGRGKTMLMDLFFEASSVAHKRRAHFHEFMADTHERMAGFRQKIAAGEISDADLTKVEDEEIRRIEDKLRGSLHQKSIDLRAAWAARPSACRAEEMTWASRPCHGEESGPYGNSSIASTEFFGRYNVPPPSASTIRKSPE